MFVKRTNGDRIGEKEADWGRLGSSVEVQEPQPRASDLSCGRLIFPRRPPTGSDLPVWPGGSQVFCLHRPQLARESPAQGAVQLQSDGPAWKRKGMEEGCS